ncbi:hypothetical protein BDV25DRAFT_128204 [Aspergillus avenaceus]|uniref:Zn(2)-C6 fungal-type domain-containing protein n=1 Tax=Aspergillus avenaceus TaxID=36643 RepID=A0A5N6U1D9_ASPAV|nr:hypothetical protein BDV25DRAFT_128204 [Aspergillus avenaceus]
MAKYLGLIRNVVRACQACHISKVRCEPASEGVSCVRCQKACRPCIPSEQTRKVRPQLNDRIAEIQSRIDMMISSSTSKPESSGRRLSDWAGNNSAPTIQQSHKGATIQTLPASGHRESVGLKANMQALLDKTVDPYLDRSTVEIIFNRYVTGMAPTFPVVVFPRGTTGADIRKNNPILLLAILDVASSGFCDIEVQRRLRKLIVQTYVHCMLRSDQYTLDLLQALIVSATWYRSIEPLKPGEQMDIYQISHTAANMALIMRLGESLSVNPVEASIISREGQPRSTHADCLAARRIWLGCHYICSNTAMSLQAPNVMRWTHCMDKCLKILETSPEALPSDIQLCHQVRLQHITEETSMQHTLKDTLASARARTSRVQESQAFSHQLINWRNSIPGGHWNGSLELSYHFSILYLQEVAFSAASRNANRMAATAVDAQGPFMITIPYHAFLKCVEAVDNIFRVFTSMDMTTIRAMPAMHLVRMIYSVLVMVKLHFAAGGSPNKDSQLQVDQLEASQRLDCMIQLFAGWGPLWPATKLTTVFRKIRLWFENETLMQQEGSWLNVWRLDPNRLVPDSEHQHLHSRASSSGYSDLQRSPCSLESPWDTSITGQSISKPLSAFPMPSRSVMISGSL